MNTNQKYRYKWGRRNFSPHNEIEEKIVEEETQIDQPRYPIRSKQRFKDVSTVAEYKSKTQEVPQKIRVLLIITGLASGGATNVVLNIASYFNDHHDFDLQLLTGPIPSYRTDVKHLAYERGIPTRIIKNLVNHIDPLKNLKAITDIRKIIAKGNYDIVHTHSSVAGVVGRIAAFTAGVPVIIHHVHGWGLQASDSRFTQALYLILERLTARFTNKIIAVSKPDIKKGISHRIGRIDKYSLIYNGIDLEKFRQPTDDQKIYLELGLDPECKIVGMIGRLDKQKNPLDFIRAAAIVIKNYSKVQFIIVGDGLLRSESEYLINELNLKEKVFLLGFRDDVAKILPILTMTVMSSLWEGLPLAFFESMSAGKPIIANNVDGACDVVINGKTGFLVTPHNSSEMAHCILDLLNNEGLCQEMGQIALQHSNSFSVEKMVEQIEILYRELHSTHIRTKNSQNFN